MRKKICNIGNTEERLIIILICHHLNLLWPPGKLLFMPLMALLCSLMSSKVDED